MEVFIAYIISGLISGSIYVLAAVATSFLLLIAGFIQLAHGEVVAIAMYVAWFVLDRAGDNLLLGIPAGVGTSTFLTILIEFLTRRLRLRRSDYECLIFSMAFGMILTEIMSHSFYHGMPVRFPKVLTGSAASLQLGVVSIPTGGIYVVLGSLLSLIGFNYLLYRTKRGMALRAIAQNVDISRILGIPIVKVTFLGFLIIGLLAGVTAVLFAMTLGFVSPALGNTLSFRALAVMLFAGLGNLKGAVVCGLLLGLIESLTTGYLFGQWTDAVAMGIIMLTIMLRPKGMFGAKV